jgi:hypothetical protein
MTQTKSTQQHRHVVVTLPDPRYLPIPAASHVDVGGTVQWRSETIDYPRFDIVFPPGKNPFNDDLSNTGFVAKGGILNPVVLEAKNYGEYPYAVVQYPLDGGDPVESVSGPINAHVCTGCPKTPPIGGIGVG